DDGPLAWVKPKPQGTYCFARPLASTSKSLIFVGGVQPGISTFLEVGIGISDPFYPVRDGGPWAPIGHWPYRGAKECRQAINDAMDLIGNHPHAGGSLLGCHSVSVICPLPK